MSVVISGIAPKSPAGRAGVLPGERLISINGNQVTDVLDYRFYMMEECVELVLQNDYRTRTVKIKKDEYDDLGLEFKTYLMDKQRSCKNKCIFCFIDQLPKGMRKSLYFKDDDDRLSFLFGNYITLTNITEEEIDRIIKLRISPVNISVHTTNPELRVRMMKNPRAGDSLRFIKKLADAGIALNCQLVLCPGINDGAELERSLRDLGQYYP
ncbi:MAG: PDZ domain-containing protein, partial [Massilioclostridium sp.]|nr:PDZ domain-containing protein [Massilioclostridium sp.]